jgi:hypothetical protein
MRPEVNKVAPQVIEGIIRHGMNRNSDDARKEWPVREVAGLQTKMVARTVRGVPLCHIEL